jgi:hypothetical protein
LDISAILLKTGANLRRRIAYLESTQNSFSEKSLQSITVIASIIGSIVRHPLFKSERILKVLRSDVRHATRHAVNISPKNAAVCVGIPRRDAYITHTKADTRIPIDVPFGGVSMEAMTGIRSSPAIAIPHRRKIAFDIETDADFGEFPEGPAHSQLDSRSRAKRNAADRSCSQMLAERTALKILPAQDDS